MFSFIIVHKQNSFGIHLINNEAQRADPVLNPLPNFILLFVSLHSLQGEKSTIQARLVE